MCACMLTGIYTSAVMSRYGHSCMFASITITVFTYFLGLAGNHADCMLTTGEMVITAAIYRQFPKKNVMKQHKGLHSGQWCIMALTTPEHSMSKPIGLFLWLGSDYPIAGNLKTIIEQNLWTILLGRSAPENAYSLPPFLQRDLSTINHLAVTAPSENNAVFF